MIKKIFVKIMNFFGFMKKPEVIKKKMSDRAIRKLWSGTKKINRRWK
jgi:hypothetical protein